jgi:hypothetical protein
MLALVNQRLAPSGLHGCIMPRPRVLCLAPGVWPAESRTWLLQPSLSLQAAAASGAPAGGGATGGGAAGGAGQHVDVVFLPDNPNPGNSNSAIFYLLQASCSRRSARSARLVSKRCIMLWAVCWQCWRARPGQAAARCTCQQPAALI